MPSASSAGQDLFGDNLPEGFHYQNDLITSAEEHQLIDEIEHLPFRDFEFHGFTGKRRVVSFGWRYDFNGGGLTKTEDMPEFLLSIRGKAARFANIHSEALQQVLVTEYAPGAAIGWHKDRSVFGDVVGVSLLSPCTFRLRCKVGTRWHRATSRRNLARYTCYEARPETNGSIASQPSISSAILSPSATYVRTELKLWRASRHCRSAFSPCWPR